MLPLEAALQELRVVLAADSTAPEWRRNVRGRLAEVKDALSAPHTRQREAWLSARTGGRDRDRFRLQGRVIALSAGLLTKRDTEVLLCETRRLLADLEHHQQRLHDLVYDSVSLELGGSE